MKTKQIQHAISWIHLTKYTFTLVIFVGIHFDPFNFSFLSIKYILFTLQFVNFFYYILILLILVFYPKILFCSHCGPQVWEMSKKLARKHVRKKKRKLFINYILIVKTINFGFNVFYLTRNFIDLYFTCHLSKKSKLGLKYLWLFLLNYVTFLPFSLKMHLFCIKYFTC